MNAVHLISHGKRITIITFHIAIARLHNFKLCVVGYLKVETKQASNRQRTNKSEDIDNSFRLTINWELRSSSTETN